MVLQFSPFMKRGNTACCLTLCTSERLGTGVIQPGLAGEALSFYGTGGESVDDSSELEQTATMPRHAAAIRRRMTTLRSTVRSKQQNGEQKSDILTAAKSRQVWMCVVMGCACDVCMCVCVCVCVCLSVCLRPAQDTWCMCPGAI